MSTRYHYAFYIELQFVSCKCNTHWAVVSFFSLEYLNKNYITSRRRNRLGVLRAKFKDSKSKILKILFLFDIDTISEKLHTCSHMTVCTKNSTWKYLQVMCAKCTWSTNEFCVCCFFLSMMFLYTHMHIYMRTTYEYVTYIEVTYT